MQALVSISRYLGRQGKKSELAIPRRYVPWASRGCWFQWGPAFWEVQFKELPDQTRIVHVDRESHLAEMTASLGFAVWEVTLIQGNKRPRWRRKSAVWSRVLCLFWEDRKLVSLPEHHYAWHLFFLPFPAVVFISPWKPRAFLEPGFVVCPGREFETIPSMGSRGRCESSQRDKLGLETRPSFRQSQQPTRVRGRGRCQGSGEPVQSILMGKFCGLILPGVTTAHCMLGPTPCLPVLCLVF